MFDKIKSSSIFKRIQKILKPILSFLKKCIRDWSLNFGAMLAFTLLVALVPLAVTFFGIVGLILKDYPDAEKKFTNHIISLVPNTTLTRAATEEIVTSAIKELTVDAPLLLVIGIIVALFGAGQLFGAIDKTLTVIYRTPQRSFLRRNLMSMGMVLIFIVFFTILVVATSIPSFTTFRIDNVGARAGIYIAVIVCSILVSFIMFELIYRLIPNKKMTFKHTWCGALVAACSLEIVIIWFPIYVENNTNNYIGLVGFALLFILLLHYFALILILGAQINAYCFEDYLPYDEGIGTVLSHVYHQHIDSDARKPLVDQNADTAPLQYQ